MLSQIKYIQLLQTKVDGITDYSCRVLRGLIDFVIYGIVHPVLEELPVLIIPGIFTFICWKFLEMYSGYFLDLFSMQFSFGLDVDGQGTFCISIKAFFYSKLAPQRNT